MAGALSWELWFFPGLLLCFHHTVNVWLYDNHKTDLKVRQCLAVGAILAVYFYLSEYFFLFLSSLCVKKHFCFLLLDIDFPLLGLNEAEIEIPVFNNILHDVVR